MLITLVFMTAPACCRCYVDEKGVLNVWKFWLYERVPNLTVLADPKPKISFVGQPWWPVFSKFDALFQNNPSYTPEWLPLKQQYFVGYLARSLK